MSIRYFENEKIFMLNTAHMTYAFAINEAGFTEQLYFGARVDEICDLPSLDAIRWRYAVIKLKESESTEYAAFGELGFTEQAIKARFADGTGDLRLCYYTHQIDGETLRLVLKDTRRDFRVTLVYRVIAELDMIERHAIISNGGTLSVTLEQMYSATVRFPIRDDYRLTYFSGRWGAEYSRTEEAVLPGKRVLETRDGFSGPEALPFIMLDEKGEATEESGSVYFATLQWSGNCKTVVEKDRYERITLTSGVNDFDCMCDLQAGESFETPVLTIGLCNCGFGGVARLLHRYERKYIMRRQDAERLMPVVYNAYGTYFSKINEERMLSVVKRAKEIGVELFVMDAGWYGTGDIESRDYVHGMGDWQVNPDRFPNGLAPVSQKVHENGMLFGLWMEPEAISPHSHLYKEHPDWILGYEHGDTHPVRDRYILNFALPEVVGYMTEKISSIIEQNAVDYFKIDFNTYIHQMGQKRGDTAPHAREGWVRYVRGLWKMYTDITERFPHIIFENCAAGGQRMDLGMLRFSGRVNRSDNQDPTDALILHEGFSRFVLPKLAGGGCHISDMFTRHFNGRVSPRRFQAHLSMAGSMAIGLNLNALSEEEVRELRALTDMYKDIRPITQNGDVYFLASATEKPYAAFEFVSEDKKEAVVFMLGMGVHFLRFPENLRLRALDPKTHYKVTSYAVADVEALGHNAMDPARKNDRKDMGVMTGMGLQNVGLTLHLVGDMDSRIIRISAID